MTDMSKGWPLLHSSLPKAALSPLPKGAYGIEGLTDVNEAYLIQRLFASGFQWEWTILSQTYLGHEDRKGRDSDYTLRYYLASVSGELVIDGRRFGGSGAHDNKKLDAAYKGAATVAFKNAAKIAGLTIELFKDGRAMDFIYEDRVQAAGPVSPTSNPGNGGAPSLPNAAPPVPALPTKTAEDILRETQERMRQQKVGGR